MIIKSIGNSNRIRRGFTLAEAMMAVVVLSVAAAGVLLPFSSGATIRAEGLHRTLGARLASDLIEEIVNTSFEQIITYYGDYSEAQGQIKDATGVVFTDPAYSNFSRSASCVYVDVPVSSTEFSSDVEFILVTVEVNYSGKSIAVINRLVSK
ncbi:prepilin-type N-terminal cleavage/methylation domain-containing protein [Planctomycetota bacterium]